MTTVGDELAELRRRAYGPDAEAHPGDLDRLQALEDALRRDPDAGAGAGTETVAADGGAEAADAAPAEPARPPEPTASARPSEPAASARPPLRTVLRRRGVLVALLAVVVIAAVLTAVWTLTRSDATVLRRLAANDAAAQQELSGSLRNYGLDPDSYVQFESFETINVWTARIPDRGLRCLLLVDQAAVSVTYNGVLGYSCTPDGLLPSVDVVQYATRAGEQLGDRPAGSVARFVFRGDRVEVTVAEARDEPQIRTPAPR